MKFVTRAQWGARPPKYVNREGLSAESTAHWNGPTVTISGKKTWDHSKCASLVRGIQNFHMDGRGWSDIAYNFLECPHGYTFEGRGLNVINGANGTTSGNRSSHAICFLAGEGNSFTEEEKIGYKECVVHISKNTLAPNSSKGHRDHKATLCPGDARYNWVHQGMPLEKQPVKEKDMLDAQDKEWLRDLATEIAGPKKMVDNQYNQSGPRRDVWRWTAEAVTLLRQVSVDKIVSGVLAGIESGTISVGESGTIDKQALTEAVEAGVKNVLLEGVDSD